jgi:hypothetical protein
VAKGGRNGSYFFNWFVIDIITISFEMSKTWNVLMGSFNISNVISVARGIKIIMTLLTG